MCQFAIVPQIIIIYKNCITLDSLKADNFWFAKKTFNWFGRIFLQHSILKYDSKLSNLICNGHYSVGFKVLRPIHYFIKLGTTGRNKCNVLSPFTDLHRRKRRTDKNRKSNGKPGMGERMNCRNQIKEIPPNLEYKLECRNSGCCHTTRHFGCPVLYLIINRSKSYLFLSLKLVILNAQTQKHFKMEQLVEDNEGTNLKKLLTCPNMCKQIVC